MSPLTSTVSFTGFGFGCGFVVWLEVDVVVDVLGLPAPVPPELADEPPPHPAIATAARSASAPLQRRPALQARHRLDVMRRKVDRRVVGCVGQDPVDGLNGDSGLRADRIRAPGP